LIKRDIKRDLEVKRYQVTSASQAVDSDIGDTVDPIFFFRGLAQGDDQSQRDGDSVNMLQTHVKANFSLANTGSAILALSYLTCMVLNCKSAPQASGATMPWTSLLLQNGAYNAWTGTQSNRLQPINLDDFEILHREDRKINFDGNLAATLAVADGIESVTQSFDFIIKYGNRKVRFEEGTTVPSTFNPFVVFAITNGDSSTNGVGALTGSVTVWTDTGYTDA